MNEMVLFFSIDDSVFKTVWLIISYTQKDNANQKLEKGVDCFIVEFGDRLNDHL